MSHQDAERILEREQPTNGRLIPHKVRIEEISKQEIAPISARRHFRLRSRDQADLRSPCTRAVAEKHMAEDSQLFEQSICVVKSTVEGNFSTHVETEIDNAGNFLVHFHYTLQILRSFASDSHLKLQDWYKSLLLQDKEFRSLCENPDLSKFLLCFFAVLTCSPQLFSWMLSCGN